MKFACQFVRYRYVTLPFRADPVGVVFQRKMRYLKPAKDFGIEHDSLVVDCAKDHRDKRYNETQSTPACAEKKT